MTTTTMSSKVKYKFISELHILRRQTFLRWELQNNKKAIATSGVPF